MIDNIVNNILNKRHMHTETKHYAVILQKLTFGENYIVNTPLGSIHAEHDVLIKYTKNIKYKDNKKIDILVVRFSKSGIIGKSRPCKNCIQRMIKIKKKCIVDIRYIYYSIDENNIVRERLDDMIDSPLTYVSSGMRDRNKNNWTFGKYKLI